MYEKYKSLFEKYADLTVSMGVNVQKGQYVVINCPVDSAPFGRMVAKAAYEKGACWVQIHWNDDTAQLINYEYAAPEMFDSVPQWKVDSRLSYCEKGGCFITILGEDPDIFAPADPDKIKRDAISRSKALVEYYEYIMGNKCCWTIIAVPEQKWANKMFACENSMDLLTEAIFKTVRILDANANVVADPVNAWKEHCRKITERCVFLNEKQFKYLHYKSSNGTDFTVGMPENHIWMGAGEVATNGTYFIANMPTEEIFCAPDYRKINGKLVSSMPLSYMGNIINNFGFEYKDGYIVDYYAETGYDTLKNLLSVDEETQFLGEIALVDKKSPIAAMKTIFYNTLFDENASCHFALGEAYPSCIQGGLDMSRDELKEKGINYSLEHVDFMVGTDDLSIIGYDANNEATVIFENGSFAI